MEDFQGWRAVNIKKCQGYSTMWEYYVLGPGEELNRYPSHEYVFGRFWPIVQYRIVRNLKRKAREAKMVADAPKEIRL